jgi:hypothetical protein
MHITKRDLAFLTPLSCRSQGLNLEPSGCEATAYQLHKNKGSFNDYVDKKRENLNLKEGFLIFA